MGQTDKQYDGQLIEEYFRLKRIKNAALKEEAAETVRIIDEEIIKIKLKLQPIELPE
ncbi:MAG: hypothetical protein NC078_11020 [Ruminococcus sp.]|nr:hypothetical protein [Ruminococcus sp.]